MIKKILLFISLLTSISVIAQPIRIVAAENFYGQIAKQMGGPYVEVTSIMNNPNQDPHLFSNSPSTAKAITQANIIIYNGLNYDSWIKNLIAVNNNQDKIIIEVAKLLGKKPGDNPHIWYSPETMLIYANALSQRLAKIDSVHAQYYQQQLSTFKGKYIGYLNKIGAFKQKYQNTPVIGTEPVFNYMADALGLKMYGKGFQLSVMNETEPSVADTKDFENKLKTRAVEALVYNSQVTNPLVEYMKTLARKNAIPVVGVSETQPLTEDYIDWMTGQLRNLEHVLESTKAADQ